MKKRGESRLLVAFDDGDLLVEETLLVGHRLEHTVEDIIEELLFGGDYDIDFGMKLVVLSSDYLCLEVGDDFWRPYFAAEQENSAVLRVSTTDVLERVVDLLVGRAVRALVLALDADGHTVAVAYEVLPTVLTAALELLIRVLCDDTVIWKRPLGERGGEYLALAGRGAWTESVAIDDGVRYSLFPPLT